MSFIYYSDLVIESKAEHLNKYWNRYWALPEKILLQHNFLYREHEGEKSDFLDLYEDDEQSFALLSLHPVISNPDEHGPGADVLFIEDEMILVNIAKEGGLFCDYERKEKGVCYSLMSFNIPDSFIGRELELKAKIIDVFEFIGKLKSSKFATVTKVDVLFDQSFIARLPIR